MHNQIESGLLFQHFAGSGFLNFIGCDHWPALQVSNTIIIHMVHWFVMICC
jgi:hypothetical protein